MQDKVLVIPRKTASFLNNEVKDYARYVIETRAMPNIMDGLRIGARKILWGAMTGDLKKKNNIKLPSLVGDALKLHYNHGDASLMNTIVQLASKHVFEFAPLEVDGQIGSLRIPKCDTAARYLGVMKTKYFDIFETDKELFEIQTEEGDKVEPKFFLPIVPVALIWRMSSPGFGFSYKAFSYDINSVIDNCIKAITNGSCYTSINPIQLMPKVEGIKSENIIFNANKDSWYNVGEYTNDFEKNTCIITDLPYNVTLEKYDEHLQHLVETNYIVNYTDVGIDGNIKYILKFAHGRLNILYQDKWKFYKQLKLYSKIPKDILNVIDEDGKKMLFFDNPYEFIDAFVIKRLKYYNKRKVKTIQVLEDSINKLEYQIKFIYLVINEELIINKRKSIEIKKDLDKFKIPYEVLKMNIDKLSQDEIDKMENEIAETKKQLEYIKQTTTKEMYIDDLIAFKNNYLSIKKMI